MSRSTVFWDTRCLLTRFACRKSVGLATSRRSAGDASASTFRSVIVLPPQLREKPRKRAPRELPDGFCRGEAQSTYRPKNLMPEDP